VHIEVALVADALDRALLPDREAPALRERSHPVSFLVDREISEVELRDDMVVAGNVHRTECGGVAVIREETLCT
jgi:hypothetical protein